MCKQAAPPSAAVGVVFAKQETLDCTRRSLEREAGREKLLQQNRSSLPPFSLLHPYSVPVFPRIESKRTRRRFLSIACVLLRLFVSHLTTFSSQLLPLSLPPSPPFIPFFPCLFVNLESSSPLPCTSVSACLGGSRASGCRNMGIVSHSCPHAPFPSHSHCQWVHSLRRATHLPLPVRVGRLSSSRCDKRDCRSRDAVFPHVCADLHWQWCRCDAAALRSFPPSSAIP